MRKPKVLTTGNFVLLSFVHDRISASFSFPIADQSSVLLVKRYAISKVDHLQGLPSKPVIRLPLTKMIRLLQGCSSVAATMQQSNMYATTGGNKVANSSG